MKFCLTMMVKDEAHVIERCLKSCLPVIDSYSILVDDRTTDETETVIREMLSHLEGVIHKRPWQGFGGTRTKSVELASTSYKWKYLLVMDADDTLVPSVGYLSKPPQLTHDAYDLEIHQDGIAYRRPLVLRASLPWRFEGVAHEALVGNDGYSIGFLPGLKVKFGGDGSRSAKKEKFLWDAVELERYLESHPDDARAVYYLAQSYRDAGELKQARDFYSRRAEMGGWDEEVFHSLLQAAVLTEKLDGDVTAAYMRAFTHSPTRAESLYNLACYFRERGDFAASYVYARAGFGLPMPQDARMGVTPAVYEWALGDELSTALFMLGHREAAAQVAASVIKKAPPDAQARLLKKIEGVATCAYCRQPREVRDVGGKPVCFTCFQRRKTA